MTTLPAAAMPLRALLAACLAAAMPSVRLHAATPTVVAPAAPAAAPAAIPPAPTARRTGFSETVQGVSIPDPYRWMEAEPQPEFGQFLHGQDDHARATLKAIPGRDPLLADIEAVDGLTTAISMLSRAGERRFYLKRDPGAQLPRLVMRRPDGTETVLVDPASLGSASSHAEIDQFAASEDGAMVAYGISTGGSENSVLHVIETAGGKPLPDVIDRARFAAVSWMPDGRSFVYTRLPKTAPGAGADQAFAHMRTYLHRLGSDPDQDTPLLDADHLPRPSRAVQAFVGISITPGSPYAIGVVVNGVAPELTLYSAPVASLGHGPVAWHLVADTPDDVVGVAVRGSRVDLLTHYGAPHLKIVETDLANPDFAHARTVVGQGSGVLTSLALAQDGLYFARRDGATMTLLRKADDAKLAEIVTLPIAGTIAPPEEDAGNLITDPTLPGADVGVESWVHPLAWLHYDPHTHAVADLGIVPPFPRDLRAYAAYETAAMAPDGTQIPLSIVTRHDIAEQHLHQPRPTLLIGYGAYGISYDPGFLPTMLPWLDRGGIVAIAHVRGGGEGGQAWHDAGRGATKMNTINDFIACAEAMIRRRITDPAHLAGSGTSAGGILIGGALTRRPDLFRAALVRVGATNALREEFTEGGPANIAEFGSIKDPAQFRALLQMDVLHQVRDGTPYPAVLLTGGADDHRVPVWEPAKLTARLQAASSSSRPVLLRVEFDAGHGIGSTRAQRDQETADEQAFLLWQMGDGAFQPR